jgi:lipopolysaccharide/colanic/teichoic acid biosynthesis glycosyltransferase
MLQETTSVPSREQRLLTQACEGLALSPRAASKALLDIAICLAILPVVLPVMAVIALAILVESGRPVFFVQERAGRCGRTFRMYKFRTLPSDFDGRPGQAFMRAFVRGEVRQSEGQSERRIFKPIVDADLTPLSRLLRRTSLDELPQIWNVLRREMSLVGPRPNVLWEVEAYQGWHYERLQTLPGITGLAQVRGRSAINFEDIVRNDIEYVRQQSLGLDLRILWWTLQSVLSGRGAH